MCGAEPRSRDEPAHRFDGAVAGSARRLGAAPVSAAWERLVIDRATSCADPGSGGGAGQTFRAAPHALFLMPVPLRLFTVPHTHARFSVLRATRSTLVEGSQIRDFNRTHVCGKRELRAGSTEESSGKSWFMKY